MKLTIAAAVMLSLMLLVACAPTKYNTTRDAYTNIQGKTLTVQTDRGLCEDSCNHDFSRCMDQRDAQDNGGVNGPMGMFGAGSECRTDLKTCLNTCKGR